MTYTQRTAQNLHTLTMILHTTYCTEHTYSYNDITHNVLHRTYIQLQWYYTQRTAQNLHTVTVILHTTYCTEHTYSHNDITHNVLHRTYIQLQWYYTHFTQDRLFCCTHSVTKATLHCVFCVSFYWVNKIADNLSVTKCLWSSLYSRSPCFERLR